MIRIYGDSNSVERFLSRNNKPNLPALGQKTEARSSKFETKTDLDLKNKANSFVAPPRAQCGRGAI